MASRILGTSGAQCVTFKARLCILAFIRGYTRGYKNFKLEYQVPQAYNFDDVIFDEGDEIYHMIRLKHKENDMKISHSHLFTDTYNTDYNLIKYVKAVINANSTDKFKDKIKTMVLFTNIDFELENDELDLVVNQRPSAKLWFNGLTSIQLTPMNPKDSIVECSTSFPNAKYYKFDQNEDLVKILKRQAFMLTLYNIDGSNSKDVVNDLEDLLTITEDEIRDALQHIIFAVCQPNDKELAKMIKTEIKDHFKLHNADAIYNELEKLFKDWCYINDFYQESSTSTQSTAVEQLVLTYVDAEEFFQKNVKIFSFNVTAPTASFTGRSKELEEMHQKFNADFQSLTISGLGGIGKTQLAKQFVKKFGQSEFYGRVIWIEAESDESVAKSFKLVAQKLNIENDQNKDTEVLIGEVFQYFVGLKILFVFDNFDKNPVNKRNFVSCCWQIANISSNVFRTFFLFTSRNREILLGVPLLDLNILSPEDAVQLIVRELADMNLTREDAEKLAKLVDYFPLALQQAIAFIKDQQKKASILCKSYDINDYFDRFEEQKQDLLDFEFPDEFGKYDETTFITSNVTLNAIKADKKYGKNAIRALQMFAFFYADKIDSKMFVTFFKDDEEITEKSILLLENYSMISNIEEESSFYQIHRLVQTIVQLKFEKNEPKLLKKAIKLVNPKLYDSFFVRNSQKSIDFRVFMKICTADQILHYKNLESNMKKHKKLMKKYEPFFQHLFSDNHLLLAAFNDDVETFKSFNLLKERLQMFVEENIVKIVEWKSYKIIKYLAENESAGLTEQVLFQLVKDESFADKNTFETVFNEFLQKGGDVNDQDKKGISLLYHATNIRVKYPHVEFNVNKIEIIHFLLDHGADSTLEKTLNKCALSNILEAYKYDKKNCLELKKLLDKMFLSNLTPDKFVTVVVKGFCTLSEWTSNQKLIEIFGRLLEEIGDINVRNEKGETVLIKYVQSRWSNVENVKFLVGQGVDVDAIDNNGKNALYYCVELRDDDVFEYLFSKVKSVDENILYNAIKHDKITIVKKLFETPIKVAMEYVSLQTLFYMKSQFIEYLEQGGDINKRDKNGNTLLIKLIKSIHWYGCDGDIDDVKFLVERGIDVNATDNDGDSALYFAVQLSENDIFLYLVDKVSSVDENVLIKAINDDKLSIVKSLIPKHFQKDYRFINLRYSWKKYNNCTPLEVAIKRRSKDIENYLITL